ncbi:MAG: hypothetical protein D6793_05010 [Thermoflexia bacterium]|nr:MAG: hypothetical protein D6793_05010 [Thermoflexia bacterium]
MGALLCVLLPFLASLPAYLLRRWRWPSALIGATVMAALGGLLVGMPLDRPISLLGYEGTLASPAQFFGRAVGLTPLNQTALAFLYFTGAALFVLAGVLEPRTVYPPLGLVVIGLLTGALVVRPLLYGVLFLQLAVALSVLLLPNGASGVRYLTFYVLALPGLMASHWLLDLYALTPDQPALLRTATLLIGLSFALMLGLVPFYPWVPALARGGTPLPVALIFSGIGGTVWFLMLDYLQTYPWLQATPQWASVLTAFGVGTMVFGGLLGMTHRGMGALLGYAVMVDTGFSILVLGHTAALGVELERALMLARTWGVIVLAAGLAASVRHSEGTESFQAKPGSLFALVMGLLSLVGFPPTVGFASRWGFYRWLVQEQPFLTALVLFSSAGPLVGLMRALPTLLRPSREAIPRLTRRGGLTDVLPALAALGALVLGLFPQWLIYTR